MLFTDEEKPRFIACQNPGCVAHGDPQGGSWRKVGYEGWEAVCMVCGSPNIRAA